MADELKKTVPTWGYAADGAKLFQLEEGEELPAGFVDSPAKLKKAKGK